MKKRIPRVKKKTDVLDKLQNVPLANAFVDSVGSFHSLKQYYKSLTQDLYCTMSVGTSAINTNLVTLEGKTISLLSLQKNSRPLVLNFGSCT